MKGREGRGGKERKKKAAGEIGKEGQVGGEGWEVKGGNARERRRVNNTFFKYNETWLL